MRRALANLHPEPAIVAAAQRAREAGIKVAMLSNSFGLEPFNIYTELGLDDLFDAVILSELEQIRKPASEIKPAPLDSIRAETPVQRGDDPARGFPSMPLRPRRARVPQ